MAGYFVVNGRFERAPNGLSVVNFFDDPRLRLKIGEDGGQRRGGIDLVVLHVTKGSVGQIVLPGFGPARAEFDAGRRVADSFLSRMDTGGLPHHGGCHLVVGADGTIYQLADLASETSYNASVNTVNERSISIECYQGSRMEVYAGQLDAEARLIGWLCNRFDLPRQFQWPYHRGPVQAVAGGDRTVRGIIGHRDATSNRGQGDPGDAIYSVLERYGARPIDFATGARTASGGLLWPVVAGVAAVVVLKLLRG